MANGRSLNWDWLWKLLAIVIIPVSIWAFTIDSRVTVIESSRFTKSDGHELELKFNDRMKESIDEIKKCLNKIQLGELCD